MADNELTYVDIFNAQEVFIKIVKLTTEQAAIIKQLEQQIKEKDAAIAQFNDRLKEDNAEDV